MNPRGQARPVVSVIAPFRTQDRLPFSKQQPVKPRGRPPTRARESLNFGKPPLVICNEREKRGNRGTGGRSEAGPPAVGRRASGPMPRGGWPGLGEPARPLPARGG